MGSMFAAKLGRGIIPSHSSDLPIFLIVLSREQCVAPVFVA